MLRKIRPTRIPSSDKSLVPKSFDVRQGSYQAPSGQIFTRDVVVEVPTDHFVRQDNADDYKLQNLMSEGISLRPVSQSYFKPTLDTISELQSGLPLILPEDEGISDKTPSDNQFVND